MKILRLGVLSGLLLGIFLSPAYAYLDPGTGSIILQVILGGVAGVLVISKLYWHNFMVFIGVRGGVETTSRSEIEVSDLEQEEEN